ncbi:hypothetical protein DERP_001560 [Dermatophagoides pteronyssinus]|uniref:Uncharacterized protein n=1 Tax=Dermatophagoides pteronyssinus TaxID=6956 RepID=A0ABQ8JBC8_DERPT|nr:hypothetical protein DERP_001560 [Dermatophagoides pteronyssinus]
MARIFPAEFDAQYGVTISTVDSHESILMNEILEKKQLDQFLDENNEKITCVREFLLSLFSADDDEDDVDNGKDDIVNCL